MPADKIIVPSQYYRLMYHYMYQSRHCPLHALAVTIVAAIFQEIGRRKVYPIDGGRQHGRGRWQGVGGGEGSGEGGV
jgi:hypothetical protein